jgi:phosphohistidine phosphatase
MDLYLIRHADAQPLGQGGIHDDAERPLTEAGHVQCQSLAQALQRRGVRLTVVVTSPLLRARETAEGLLRHWSDPKPELQTCAELAPGGRRKKLARSLNDLAANAVALVGHQPDLFQLVGWLIGSKKAQIEIAKSGTALVACPDGVDKGAGSLVWLATPEWYAL